MIQLLIQFLDFICDHFDKLLLTGIFLILVMLVVHMSHDQADAGAVNWAREAAGTVLGGLLGLITGGLLSRNNRPQAGGDIKEPKP